MTHRPPLRPASSARPAAIARRSSALRRSALAALAFALAVVAPRASAVPLTVEEGIKLALQNNQRVKVSAFGPEIGKANVLAAYGAFDPALTFRRSYREDETPGIIAPLLSRTQREVDDYQLSLDGLTPWGMTYSLGATANNTRGTATSVGHNDNYATFGGVTITQPLLRGFGFGATLATLRVTKASRGISDWQHRQTVIDTVTAVILGFNNLQLARANLAIARASRGNAAQLLDESEKKNRVGAVADADVTQARASLAIREENVLFAERGVRDSENQLRLLIGDTAFRTGGPDFEIVELAPAPNLTVDPAADLKKAYELRPDYQIARLGLTIDRANNAAARNALLPRLDFVGSYGYGGASRDFGDARGQIRDEDSRAYSAGVVVRIPLTFAEGRGRARAAKLTVRQTEADLVRIEQDIAIAITNAAGNIETTQQRIAATRIARDLTAQALDAEQKKFRAGTGRTLDIINVQGNLAVADNSYARALADQRRAVAVYEQLLGVTLATHNIVTQ
jgi:outer membrane protein